MKIDIITLFPKMFDGPFSESIISRAQKRGLVNIKIHQLRDWAINRRGQVDDSPYGGGAGMILRIDVAFKALSALNGLSQKISNFQFPISNKIQNLKSQKLIKLKANEANPYIILPTPSGKKFNQALVCKLSKKKHLVFLCPHYEGYDKRIESLVDEKISIGDYVLTGGELPVAVMVDTIIRLIPGVINDGSLREESFSCRGLINQTPTLEYPQYTRPEVFKAVIKGKKIKKRVPKVLLSGNHALIERWRKTLS